MAEEPDIDAVYTWVDGSGLADLDRWRSRLAGVLDDANVGDWSWRDNQEPSGSGSRYGAASPRKDLNVATCSGESSTCAD